MATPPPIGYATANSQDCKVVKHFQAGGSRQSSTDTYIGRLGVRPDSWAENYVQQWSGSFIALMKVTKSNRAETFQKLDQP